MISRRNLRIKILQSLYAAKYDDNVSIEKVSKEYRKSVDKAFDLLIFTMYVFYRVCNFSLVDSENRKSKLRPTEVDLNFEPFLAENHVIEQIREDSHFHNMVKKKGFAVALDNDIIKKLYYSFWDSPDFKEIGFSSDISDEYKRKVMLLVLRHIIKSELFLSVCDDLFFNWHDDETLIKGAIKKCIKEMPYDRPFYEVHALEEDKTDNFGEILVKSLLENSEMIENHFEPLLKNWDSSRVTVLDWIIIKMGVAEFLFFPNIPINVTINEYVDLSKKYSTHKSKEFINGVLDRCAKNLQKSDVISKL